MMIKRLIGDLILFFSIFWLTWYWTAILAFLLMIFFRNFWEGVAAMLFLDLLYSIPTGKIYGHFGIFTIAAVISLLLIEKAKTRIRFL